MAASEVVIGRPDAAGFEADLSRIPAEAASTELAEILPRYEDHGLCLIPGRAGKIRSLTFVLKGNCPRFPWEPSTTMLNYRLIGNTEKSVSCRNKPNHWCDAIARRGGYRQ